MWVYFVNFMWYIFKNNPKDIAINVYCNIEEDSSEAPLGEKTWQLMSRAIIIAVRNDTWGRA